MITTQTRQGRDTNAYYRYKQILETNPDMSLRALLLLGLAADSTFDNVSSKEGFSDWEALNSRIVDNAHLFNQKELLDNIVSTNQRLYRELQLQMLSTQDRRTLDDKHIQALYKKAQTTIEHIPAVHPHFTNAIRQLSYIGFLLNDSLKYSDMLLSKLGIIERTYGKFHPLTTTALENIGRVLHLHENRLSDAYYYYQEAYQRSELQGPLYRDNYIFYTAWSLSYMGLFEDSLDLLFKKQEVDAQSLDWEDSYGRKYDRIWNTLEFFPDMAYEQVVLLQQWLGEVPDTVNIADFNMPGEQLFLDVLKATLEGRFEESIKLFEDKKHVIDGNVYWPKDALEEYLYRKRGDFATSLIILDRYIPKHDDLGIFSQDGLYQDAYLWQAQGLAEIGKPKEAAAVLQACFDFSYNLRAEPDNFWLKVVATMADYYNLPLDTYELTVPLMDNNFLLTGGKQRLMPQQ